MPEFYDKEDCHGVKITVTPNNRLFKRQLKRFSRSVAVGEAIDLTLQLERLDDFNAHFWEKREVISQLPERKNERIAEIKWGDEQHIEKRMLSIQTDCTGEVYFRMPKVQYGYYDLKDDDTIPVFFSTVTDKSEIRRNIIIGLFLAIFSFVLGLLTNFFLL